MNRLALLSLVVVACKSPSTQKAQSPGDGGPSADAAGSAADVVDEAAVRAGKRTGLATPDEKPEVATEPLARNLIRGATPWSKVVDNAVGVVELADGKVTHRCGAALDHALAAFAAGAAQALDAPGLVYDVACDNVGLSVAIPGVTSHAVCTVASPAGEGLEFDLVFVPDATLGLRLIGLSAADAVATDDALRDQFDDALGRFGARCR